MRSEPLRAGSELGLMEMRTEVKRRRVVKRRSVARGSSHPRPSSERSGVKWSHTLSE
jgi:hypothetical protein